LRSHYVRIEAEADSAGSAYERIKTLYRGLRDVKFAQKLLHPDVANLEPIFFEADLGRASSEMLKVYQTRLEEECRQGRLRAEFSAIFGHFLDEWLESAAQPVKKSVATAHPFDDKLQLFLTLPEAPIDLAALAALFDRYRPAWDDLRTTIQSWAEKEVEAAVTTELVQGILKILGDDITREPEIRRRALDAANSPLVVNELAGALTVLMNNLDDWAWSEEGFDLKPLWSRTKYRPYLEEDLLTLLFQSLVGLRWGVLLRQQCTNWITNPVHNPQPNTPFHDPESTGYNSLSWLRAAQHGKLLMPMIPQSLSQLQARSGYGGYESRNLTPDKADAFQELLLTVNAEIRLRRAANSDHPLYVVQTDLRDFYLRIPHEAVLFIVERLGFPPRWLQFFKKFLAVPIRHRGAKYTVRRGLMLDHILSDVFAEFLLFLLDLHVYEQSGVRLLRLVDDVFFVTDSREKASQAWNALRGFCGKLGLEPNPAKSGSAALGGEPPPELPQGPPRWGMLRLTPTGEWELDRENWDQFKGIVRRQLQRPMPVLTLISLYNSALNYIVKFLGMLVPLGPAHRQQIARAAVELHHGLFEKSGGLVDEVRRRWQANLGKGSEPEIPEVLYYWPLTAGGLGLYNPAIALAAHHQPALDRKPPTIPPAIQFQSFGDRWSQYYQAWLQPIQPARPDSTPGLQALFDDFVARSSEVAGRGGKEKEKRNTRKPAKKRGLTLYWQWIVFTYGPQLLSALGTFRFLIPELVPLQVIVENRIGATSLADDAQVDGGGT
jgi:hypothetical protein